MTIGEKPRRAAIDKYKALPVSRVIHQIITKLAIDDPSNETSCPDQKDR